MSYHIYIKKIELLRGASMRARSPEMSLIWWRMALKLEEAFLCSKAH